MTLFLDIPNMLFRNSDKVVNLTPQQFKVLYQFFRHGQAKDGQVLYDSMPIKGVNARKIVMVSIKSILPDGSYENIHGKGYKIITKYFKWEIIY